MTEPRGVYMRLSAYSRIIAVAGFLTFLPTLVTAQGNQPAKRTNNAPPKPSGVTPRTPDGHPDLSGVWNGLGDNLLGVPNQIANDGISVGNEGAHDIASGAQIAIFPRTNANTWDVSGESGAAGERAATLLRRMGSNKPIYKPQYWKRVKDFDANSNEEDPSNNCMPAGVPRMGVPSYIAQTPTYLIFIYPGQGGLIATATSYRMIPTDGRKHTNLEDLDGTWNGESIGHWEGDTMVVDTIG